MCTKYRMQSIAIVASLQKVLAPGCKHVNSSENLCADNSSNITEGWAPFSQF